MRIKEEISDQIEAYLKNNTVRVPNQRKPAYIRLKSFTTRYNNQTNSNLTTVQMWVYLEDMRYYITRYDSNNCIKDLVYIC